MNDNHEHQRQRVAEGAPDAVARLGKHPGAIGYRAVAFAGPDAVQCCRSAQLRSRTVAVRNLCRRESEFPKGAKVSARGIYKGYTFASMSTLTDRGQYRAKVAIMALGGTRTRSQRFLDLDTFRTEAEANDGAVAGAMAWIDANDSQDGLALPTDFASFA